jgi:hypothetical protein
VGPEYSQVGLRSKPARPAQLYVGPKGRLRVGLGRLDWDRLWSGGSSMAGPFWSWVSGLWAESPVDWGNYWVLLPGLAGLRSNGIVWILSNRIGVWDSVVRY